MSAQDLEQRALEYQHVLDMLGVATHEEAGAEIGRLHAAALRQQPAPVVRDRELDRKHFPDAAFNEWLDTGISDAGHTVWDAVGDTQAAWAGWDARLFAGDAVMLPECCGREECGGECGNDWLGMRMYRKPTDQPAPVVDDALNSMQADGLSAMVDRAVAATAHPQNTCLDHYEYAEAVIIAALARAQGVKS